MKNRNLIIWGSSLAVLGVVLGAFAAHILDKQLSEDELMSFQTGVRYQIYHALAILISAVLPLKNIRICTKLFVWGTLLFSGSIYLLTLDQIMGVNFSGLGWITPIGGLVLIAGWLQLIRTAYRS
jgi:uncharacterized membrane protein YgdD (TMEM256/DUF423 family)